MPFRQFIAAALLAVGAVSLCGGCAGNPSNPDPWEKANRFIYNVNDGFDRAALKPAADAYVKVVPQPIRQGIGNGFDNLVYLNVIINDFLQAKWGQGLGDSGRMAANSIVGIGGIFDVATKWGLPAHQNDFGITLGKWGVKPGPYLVLPLFGPSSLRDVSGLLVEYVATPTFISRSPHRNNSSAGHNRHHRRALARRLHHAFPQRHRARSVRLHAGRVLAVPRVPHP